jgi:hypothetical protein
MLGIFLGVVALIFVFQRQLAAVLGWIINHTLERFIGSDSREE